MIDNGIKLILNEIHPTDQVFDIGCAHHSSDNESKDYWLHKHLCKTAKNVMSVDILENDVHKLCKLGYNIVAGNVETVNLNEKFDVIVMGEFIEHVSNVGIILDNIRSHLDKDEKLILTTQNTSNIIHFITILLNGKLRINAEHVIWYNMNTLNTILKRHGFEILHIGYSKAERRHSGWILSNLIFLFKQQLGALGYLIVARLDA